MPRGDSANSVPAAIAEVLAPSFLRHLRRMRLLTRRAVGGRPGNTPVRSGLDATGIELERYKTYAAGDELRFVDWNAYARLDQLLVKRFRAEREAPLHLLVDGSASMGSPEEDGKFTFAMALAISLAYVATRHHDPVRIVVLGTQRLGGYAASPVVRLPALLPQLTEFCRGMQPGGGTPFPAAVAAYLHTTRTRGLAVVISDLLVEQPQWRDTVRLLAGRGYDVAALRPLGAHERDPSRLFRRGRLLDVETGGERIVRLTPQNLERYQRALGEHLEMARRECAANGALFSVCDTDLGVEHCLFTDLPRVGLVH